MVLNMLFEGPLEAVGGCSVGSENCLGGVDGLEKDVLLLSLLLSQFKRREANDSCIVPSLESVASGQVGSVVRYSVTGA